MNLFLIQNTLLKQIKYLIIKSNFIFVLLVVETLENME